MPHPAAEPLTGIDDNKDRQDAAYARAFHENLRPGARARNPVRQAAAYSLTRASLYSSDRHDTAAGCGWPVAAAGCQAPDKPHPERWPSWPRNIADRAALSGFGRSPPQSATAGGFLWKDCHSALPNRQADRPPYELATPVPAPA